MHPVHKQITNQRRIMLKNTVSNKHQIVTFMHRNRHLRRVLVLAHKSKVAEWHKNMSKYQLYQCTVTSYQNYNADRLQLLILDDAMQVSSLTHKQRVSLGKSSKLVMLLSDFPVQHHISDIRFLINMMAEQTVLPTNKYDFDMQYKSLNRPKAITDDYLTINDSQVTTLYIERLVIMSILYAIIGRLILYVVIHNSGSNNTSISPHTRHIMIQSNGDDMNGIDIYQKAMQCSMLWKSQNEVEAKSILFKSNPNDIFDHGSIFRSTMASVCNDLPTSSNLSGNLIQKQKPGLATTIVLYMLLHIQHKLSPNHNHLKQIKSIQHQYNLPDVTITMPVPKRPLAPIIQTSINILRSVTMFCNHIEKLTHNNVIDVAMYLYMVAYNIQQKMHNLYEYDIKALCATIAPYYTPIHKSTTRTGVTIHHAPFDLSRSQICMLYRMLTSTTTAQDRKLLPVSNYPANDMMGWYTNYGRIVGSIGPNNKFQQIIDMHTNNPQRTFVYSAFSDALGNFKDTATKKQCPFVHRDATYDKNTPSFVLVNKPAHKSYTFDILHILEPPRDHQIYARLLDMCARSTSPVRVYIWCGSIPMKKSMLRNMQKIWASTGAYELPFIAEEDLVHNISPDCMVKNQHDTLQRNISQFKKYISTNKNDLQG